MPPISPARPAGRLVDKHGGDHFRVFVKSVNNSTNDQNAKWKLNKAHWELCEESLKIDKFDTFLGPSR